LALLLIAGCSDNNKETAATQNPVANESAVDKAFNQSFIQSCENAATQSGKLSRADANKICQCSLISFRKKYSAEQVVALDNASDTEKMELAKFSIEVGTECTQKFMMGEL